MRVLQVCGTHKAFTTLKFDFEGMESAHMQRHAQLQGQFDEYRCAAA